jgi:hypothetical protein
MQYGKQTFSKRGLNIFFLVHNYSGRHRITYVVLIFRCFNYFLLSCEHAFCVTTLFAAAFLTRTVSTALTLIATLCVAII